MTDILHKSDTPWLSFIFFTGYGACMSILFLRLLTAQLSTSYSRLLAETQGFAVLSAASYVLQLEATLSQPRRQKLYDEHGFENRLTFDRMDLGIAGGIQSMDPLWKWPVVEHDRVVRMTGAAGPEEPWPIPPSEASVEERITALDTRVRQIVAIATNAAEAGVNIAQQSASHKKHAQHDNPANRASLGGNSQ